MDNPSFVGQDEASKNGSMALPSYEDVEQRNGAAAKSSEKTPQGPLKKAYKTTKSSMAKNKYTRNFCPPTGEVATTLTLILTIIAVFFGARTVLGPIADIGGTIFALLMLILIALIGGKLVLLCSWLLKKFCKVDIRLPPLLGMLIVGIVLKNVPYNFGQFGRSECALGTDGKLHNTTFADSLHQDTVEEGQSWRRRRDVVNEDEDYLTSRIIRSVQAGGHSEAQEADAPKDDCKKQYIGHDLDPDISRTLRNICLCVILLMAGLELDPVALMKLSAMVVRATFIPCFVEAITIAILSNLILGLPWTVGFMLGFVLAAVSPAVIIPCLMSLSQRGYGVAKGIPTLVIAACSADDVVAISGFGIFLGLTFNTGAPILELVLHGPIEVLIGVSFGIVWGLMAQWIPNKDHHHVAFFRWLILFGGGLIALFGAHLIHYDGAGGLATIILAFVAGMKWRKEGWGDHNPVTKTFQRMWIILEPIIFALIGTEIQVDKINFSTLGLSVVVLLVALVIRMISTYFAVHGGELNMREKVFMAFAWLPKATVQAALGPIFLDKVMSKSQREWEELAASHAECRDVDWDPTMEWSNCSDPVTWLETKNMWLGWGNDILTLAVLSILITAPLGAVSILGLGPKLLHTDIDQAESGDENSDTEAVE